MADARLQSDLQRLAEKRPDKAALGTAKSLPSIAAQTSVSSAASASGYGIASPLTENDYSKRTWHPDLVISTTDGIFTFAARALQSITMADANNRQVVLEFDRKPDGV